MTFQEASAIMRAERVPQARKRNPYRRTRTNGEAPASAVHEAAPAVKPHAIVRKAVFPVAGLDTGLLPATKAAPKEMLTVVDKPLIHYAVEEAVAAGIREMIFVTDRNKRAIEDHFDRAYELESTLAAKERESELRDLQRHFPQDVKYVYVRSRDYSGLGEALACVRPLVGGEPFALILPDELIDSSRPAIAQILDCFYALQQPVVGVQPRRSGDVALDTLRTGTSYRERTHHVVRFSRDAGAEPGGFIAAGRYVLTASIFAHLSNAPGHGLHDALVALLGSEPLLACDIAGERFSCRTKLGLLSATVHYGLKHPELAGPFREVLRQAGRAPLPPAGVASTGV
jgi:UTP--glucose-1-phosphate uridylyltransferase